MPASSSLRKGFTFVELLTTLVIISVLISVSIMFVGNMAKETHRTADAQTLTTLNDALNYYKSMGGDIEGLTQEVSVTYIINKLKTPISHWGTTYQFIPADKEISIKDIEATGYGDYLRFTRYDTYSQDTTAPKEQAAVSRNATIDYLQSFTPTILSGGKAASYEISWGNNSSWQALGSYTPASAGTYSFYVRNTDVGGTVNTTITGPYILTVNKISQAGISSADGTITYGNSFTPSVSGGSGSGSWQTSWNSTTSWGALSAYTPAAAGTENFYVKKLGDTNYFEASMVGPYTLTINKAAQAAASSAGGSISCGGSFTPSVSGGSGTGAYQMYWTDVGSWQSVASRTFGSTGSYTFKVRKLGDTNYNTSAESSTYTLAVNGLTQAVVSSAGGTIDYLDSFTPVVSGGSGSGAYQMSWGDNSSWEAVGAYTPATAGTEEFYVRRLASGCYGTSSVAGPYTLTINRIAQATITSASDSINCGSAFTPSTAGGSGTGEWQMYWSDTTTWETLASRTFSSPASYDFWIMKVGDTNYVQANTAKYTLTVSSLSQAAVTSTNGTITYGGSFTLTPTGGSGSGAYQMSWGDNSSWEALAAYTPTAAGSETFYVRRLASGCYTTSATSPAYTLTINKADQAAVTSANGTINCGSSFTPTTSGGSSTGAWQMYWTDIASWQTLAARTFSSSGSYTFRVRKLGDANYNDSAQSALYTLTVNILSQAAVTSANGTITYGSSFTPTTSGGNTGTWQMTWNAGNSWATVGAHTPAGAGSYSFNIRRLASGCYSTSATSPAYTLTVNKANQPAVTSANGTINCGSSFTPTVSGGSGTGAWQMYWTDVGTWQTRAARTFSSSGSYTFRVRKLGDDNYNTSSQSSLYTLTVNNLSQAAVSSANGTITYGGSFTPTTSGGSAGTWQMYWSDTTTWQTLAARSGMGAGSYSFYVRRAASGCYNTSATSSAYTLTINKANQAAVTSANGTINCGSSFTPTVSGGSGTGAWQMYWTDVGTWQTRAARTFGSSGSYTFRVRKLGDANYNTSSQSSLYTLTVNNLSQAAVSSANGTITYGSSFTPTTSGGSAGTWQMYWSDTTTWQTLAARSGMGAGSYTFYVRRAASGCYNTSATSSAYTLTVNKANQAAVTSANGSINCGSSFTPSVSGGSGTGGWQMYWTDVGSWQTRAARTFSSSGSYTFRVRKLGDANYNTSSQSSLYTLTVNNLSQAAVSSANGTINCGSSFTPTTSGGSAGTWQMLWTDVGSWQTLASRTFSSAGSYTFRVRRTSSGCYNYSSQSSLYTLTVNALNQSAVSSANGVINKGSSFTPSTSGGSAGTWQMYWSDVGSWQTLAGRTFSSAGTYTFRVRRAASGCYNTSTQSGLYTLYVKSNDVIAQNYNAIGGCCGCFTLRQYIAGEYGTGYGPYNSTITQLNIADSKYSTWSGQSIRGYIYPPSTGTYTFKFRGYEYSDLWVGTAGAAPDDYSRYAYFGGSSGQPGSSGESSFTVSMVAGQRYPFVFYHTNWELTSGDSAYVKWSGPGVSENYLSSTYISRYPE